jgi:DNA mismatch repair ATPase MutS
MKTKKEYIERLASELKEWSAQIDLLAAKSENAAAQVKLRYAEELDELRAKQQAAAEKIRELEEAGGDAWDTVKATADQVWDDLKNGLASAVSKFK